MFRLWCLTDYQIHGMGLRVEEQESIDWLLTKWIPLPLVVNSMDNTCVLLFSVSPALSQHHRVSVNVYKNNFSVKLQLILQGSPSYTSTFPLMKSFLITRQGKVEHTHKTRHLLPRPQWFLMHQDAIDNRILEPSHPRSWQPIIRCSGILQVIC